VVLRECHLKEEEEGRVAEDPQESCAVQGNPFDAEGAPRDVQLLDNAGEM
jgi:hypothetical protein